MQNNLICLMGVLNDISSTNISMAKSFMRHGFEVIPVNYRSIISQYGMQTFEDMVLSIMKKYRPYMTLFAKCNTVSPNLIEECNKYSHTWLWNPDPISTIKQCPEVIQHARNADFSSCTGGGTAKWFREQGAKNCYTIFDGLDIDIFKPVEPLENLKADISLIGTKTKEREEIRERLLREGFTVGFYGDGYKYKAINLAFSQVCSSSKFMLSVNSSPEAITNYFSNRLLRYMGCGSCVLHYDPTETLKNYFKDGEEILFFKSIDELIDKIKNTDDETAKKIGDAGRRKVLENFTWEDTIKNILGYVRKAPKKKVLIKYHHGLGDVIALTPQLRYLWSKGYQIDLMCREEVTSSHILDDCKYINKIITIPNPWRDKELRTPEEYNRVEKENTELLESLEGYDLKLNVDHKNIPQDIPKTIFNSMQCEFTGMTSYDKEIFIPKDVDKQVRQEIAKRFPDGYTFKHTIIPNHEEHSVGLDIDFGLPVFDTSKEILNKDINYTFAYIKYASHIIVSSSVMSQAAEALGKKIDILNFGKCDVKVLPDPSLIDQIYFKGTVDYKYTWYSKLKTVLNNKKVLISGAGRSGTNWLTEIIRASGAYRFTDVIEDRNFFNYDYLPNGYGTKLATENKGFTLENIRKVMSINSSLKILFAIRHPVDLCMAKIYRGQPSSQGGDGEDRLAPDATVKGAISAVKYSESILEELIKTYSNRVLAINLEDLIENTEVEIDKICKFLGIEKKEEMLTAYTKNRNTNHQKRYGDQVDKSQGNLRDNWQTVYNGFFADKEEDIKSIKGKFDA